MGRKAFQDWLFAYGAAWEALDPDAYLPLFTDTAEYHWAPFEAPKSGHEEIRSALKEAMSRQEAPQFSYKLITVEGETGWAEWACRFTRKGTDDPVRIEGILKAVFEQGKCCEFREWWHVLEPGQGDLMRDFDA
ncbi:nuclear transport factor 2 family protein [Henriciella sp.]|uniref:nuclear transport factor 2 family protein n=1 Tax=Henriciella sp. TaxID=1968823 RepID=UPI00262AE9DE|nr:nuclear transport factor 2 family protein [Henriciella sp.]